MQWFRRPVAPNAVEDRPWHAGWGLRWATATAPPALVPLRRKPPKAPNSRYRQGSSRYLGLRHRPDIIYRRRYLPHQCDVSFHGSVAQRKQCSRRLSHAFPQKVSSSPERPCRTYSQTKPTPRPPGPWRANTSTAHEVQVPDLCRIRSR